MSITFRIAAQVERASSLDMLMDLLYASSLMMKEQEMLRYWIKALLH